MELQAFQEMITLDYITFIEIKLMRAVIADIAVEFRGFAASFSGDGIDIMKQLLSNPLALMLFRNIDMVGFTGSSGVMAGHKPESENPNQLSVEENSVAFIVLSKHFLEPFLQNLIRKLVAHKALHQGQDKGDFLL